VRVVVQRVRQAAVIVDEETIGAIGNGLLILIGVTHDDDEEDARWMAQKVAALRIFEDQCGKFNLSALDVGASALIVSQFTLYADARRGRRPDFIAAAKPELADQLIKRFVDLVRAQGLPVETGRFQARMLVSSSNDGPVTIILDSPPKAGPNSHSHQSACSDQ
jgi:D-aminoacyl-tRNA deacylase